MALSDDSSRDISTSREGQGDDKREEGHNGEVKSEMQIPVVAPDAPTRSEALFDILFGRLRPRRGHPEIALETDGAGDPSSNGQSWHVFSHEISVKTGFPDGESSVADAAPLQSNHTETLDLVDSLEIEEKTIKLPAQQRKQLASRQKQQESQELSQPVTYDLTVVVPTRNEHDNIMTLLLALREARDGMRVEIIFVDDSDDDTPEIIMDSARTMNSSLFHIQLEHRLAGDARAGGLATAVVHGMNRAQADYVAVIDADLQHPTEQLRVFYDQAVAQNADLVLASRYIKGGSNRGLAGVGRRFISVGLKWTAKLLFPEQLLRISDPLGGFFLLRRSLLADVSLRPIGYKILLEILIRCQWRQVIEVPYQFRARAHGQSKAKMRQGILAKTSSKRITERILSYLSPALLPVPVHQRDTNALLLLPHP